MASYPNSVKSFPTHVDNSGEYVLAAHINDIQNEVVAIETQLISKGIAALTSLIYPVGSIYMSVNSANPSTLFGGTWSAWGAGRVPVGKAASGTFATGEDTGGAETHTLSVAEMPTHNHSGTLNQGAPNTSFTSNDTALVADARYGTAVSGKNAFIAQTGGGGAHNNLQPYIVCYMWKRTG